MNTLQRRVAALGTVVAALAACGSPASTAPPPTEADPGGSPSGAPGVSPAATSSASPAGSRAVIIDTDLAGDDITAIAILLRDPGIDVRAVTVAGTGEVHCAPGLRNLRNILADMGRPEIPIGCGRETAGPEAYPWPDAWRAGADSGYGITFAPTPGTQAGGDAVAVIGEAVATAPSAPLVVALGPWTNLQDALEADPGLAGRIAGIYAMGGTLDAPGNLWADDTPLTVPVEFNFGADPAAVAAVLATAVPVTLVPLDATNDAPFPAGLVDALATDHAAAGADLVFEMYARNPFLTGEGQYLWDSLTALTLLDPTLVTWQDATVRAVTARPNAGQVARDPAGRPIRAAAAADGSRVEAALLAALRRGGPRAHPFTPVGELGVTWDGASCTTTRAPTAAGLQVVTVENRGNAPAVVAVAGARAPKTWADLLGLLDGIDLSTQPPEWVVTPGSVSSDPGATARGYVEIPAGTFGPICLTGEWPRPSVTPGTPFDVAP